jgi:microcystin-dependent protein
MEAYLGMISMFGISFAPKGWMLCNGQTLSIAQYSALFALLGTNFGGDGQTTFALPNFQGRMPMGTGNGQGLSPRVLGQMSGTESVSLTQLQMPAHTHQATATSTSTSTTTATLHAETSQADARNPLAKMLSTPPAGAQIYADPVPADNKAMAPDSIVATTNTTTATTVTVLAAGGSQPVGIMPPFLAVTFCICLQGIFPSRN